MLVFTTLLLIINFNNTDNHLSEKINSYFYHKTV